MQPPTPDPDTIFAELLKDLPPETEPLAREFKAFTRPRKIKTVAELFRLVLLFAGLDQSEREVAANVILVHPEIGGLTDEAVKGRLAACLPWLEALLPTLIKREQLPALPSGLRLSVVDASTISAPGQKGVTWRIHLALDLVHWRLRGVRLTDVQTGETLLNFDFDQGEVTIAERGYCQRQGVAHLLEQGAAPIVRCQPQQFPLETRTGEALDVAAALAECAPGETQTLAVQFSHGGQTYPLYLHAYRLPEQAAAAARRRRYQAAKKGGYTPSATSLFLAEFVLVLTSIPPEVLSAATILALYRCRWQVELLFKHFKSLLDVDAVRARAGSVLGKVWLHGKMVYACLIARRALRRCGPDWTNLDTERRGTWWRVWQLIKAELTPLITLSQCWDLTAWPEALTALAERKRKRRLQTLPLAVAILLEQPARQAADVLRGAS